MPPKKTPAISTETPSSKGRTPLTTADAVSKYKHLSQRDQILLRPSQHVGSTKTTTKELWVASGTKIEEKNVKYNPALVHIFYEVLSNAQDNYYRSKGTDTPLKKIEVTVTDSEVTVWNDGLWIPVKIHQWGKDEDLPIIDGKPEDLYEPEIIFGMLNSSSNYDDSGDGRQGAGLHGVGVKLTNIFSKKFEIECFDPESGQKFVQEYTDGMSKKSQPKITKLKKTTGWTQVKYTADFERFEVTGYNKTFFSIVKKMCIDCAMNTGAKIIFNGETIPVKSLKDYAMYYLGSEESRSDSEAGEGTEGDPKKVQILELNSDDSSVILVEKSTRESAIKQVSFVNGIVTSKGGIHVDTWVKAIFKPLFDKIKKKYTKKGSTPLKLTQKNLQDYFMIFVKCNLKNPEFDGQTKNVLNNPEPTVNVPDSKINGLMKWDFIHDVEETIRIQGMKELKKTDGKKTASVSGIDNADDANLAGGKESLKCTLFIVEGLSAKSFCVKGISALENGRNYYGILPVKGKVLNVRGASAVQINANKEITNIKRILGLQHSLDYSDDKNMNTLRYGSVRILTDADSVTADTPLLLQNENGEINIKTIDTLTNDWSDYGDKQIGNTNYKVWTDSGWTLIKQVIKHRVNKRIFRIVTHTGYVDCTEDHSLITENGIDISPKDCELSTKLLHSFPNFQEVVHNIDKNDLNSRETLKQIAMDIGVYRASTLKKNELFESVEKYINTPILNKPQINNITEDEAYLWGFFWSDGTAGYYEWESTYKQKNRPRAYTFTRKSYQWSISNTNLEYLNESLEIVKKLYPEYAQYFCIINDRHNEKIGNSKFYKIILNGGQKTKHISILYRSMFYDKDKNKIVPTVLFNSPMNIRKAFFKGVYIGDGAKNGMFEKFESTKIAINGKIGAMGIYYIAKSIGYLVSLNCRTDKPKIINLHVSKLRFCRDPVKIKKIIDLGVQDVEVYDLETENHHFHAGVGELIVHNTDGCHIQGLIINFFHFFYPDLLKRGFVKSMRTPTVKATIGKKVYDFYYLKDFKDWESVQTSKFVCKTYKGLGTSTDKDILEIFEKPRYVNFIDDATANHTIDMVFNKTRAEDRKKWLQSYEEKEFVYPVDSSGDEQVKLTDFFNNEMIKFSIYDNQRSIPNVIDGLKPSQRKVIWVALQVLNTKDEYKVAQFGNEVARRSAYHHGENSLIETIVGLAQTFVGSNNISFLTEDGQFGTRMSGGLDAANARYIFTRLASITRYVFRKEDDPVLHYLDDDGKMIEPKFFVGVIPNILCGNCKGVGTGFSTSIPSYNPLDIVKFIRNWLKNKDYTTELKPWYFGFKGSVEKEGNKITYWGNFNQEKTNSNYVYRITELPIGVWTSNYKEKLEKMREDKIISKIEDYTTSYDVDFKITSNKELDHTDLHLKSTCQLTNLTAFTAKGGLKKYSDISEMLNEFCEVRLHYYGKRKKYLLESLQNTLAELKSKMKFIKKALDDITILKQTEDQLFEYFESESYYKKGDSYKYLTDTPVRNFTTDKVELLKKQINEIKEEIEYVTNTEPKDMWEKELSEFEKAYEVYTKEILDLRDKIKSKKIKSKK